MSGLEKIVNQILDEAKSKADDIIKDAKETVKEIQDQASKERSADEAELNAKLLAEEKNYQERMASSVEFKRRKALLSAKQNLITEIIDKAYERMVRQEDGEYFKMIWKLLEKAATDGDGVICFSKEDLKRLPADADEKVRTIAAAKGGKLSISKETRDIESGFILAYGGIEENCTLKALFDSKKDELFKKR